MKGQDLVVLLGLIDHRGVPPTLHELAKELELSPATIQRSLGRLAEAGLLSRDRRVLVAQADEFLTHGLRYLFPVKMAGESRGVLTSWAAPALRSQLAGVDESGPPPVWPHPTGTARGIALEPVHPVVPALALRNETLYERLALLDALRSGDARLRGLARSELRRHLAGESR